MTVASYDLQRQLPGARSILPRDGAPRSAGRIGVRIVQVGVIQRVKGLGAEFAVHAFRHPEYLQEASVPLVLVGTADAVETQRHIADVGGQLFRRVGFKAAVAAG